MIDVKQMRSFLSIVEEEGNAEFREDTNRPWKLERVRPRDNSTKKTGRIFSESANFVAGAPIKKRSG